jgi:hypothetical protein
MIDFLGSRKSDGLYIQFRVFRFSKGANIPIASFWSDTAPRGIRQDRVYFFSPGLRPFGKSQVTGSFCLWLDFDGVEDWHSISFHAEPSMLVATGGGFHVYWRLNELLDFDTLSVFLKRLIQAYPAADPMCSDPTRFLRWPGSYNLKFDPARLCTIVHRSQVVYSPRQLWIL